MSGRELNNLSQWKKYYRDYTTQANFLHKQGYLSELEYTGYFWYGIPEDTRKALEIKLWARYPAFNNELPWPIEYVSETADNHFRRDKFTDRLLHAPTFGNSREYNNSDSDSDYYSSDSENSDSDSEDERYHYRKHKRHSRKKPRSKRKSMLPKITHKEDDRTRKINAPPEEIEGMIEQLNSMSLDDPKYGQIYYRVMKLDTSGIVEKCIRRPPY